MPPNNSVNTPPLAGNLFANSAIADAAFAEFCTTPASSPATLIAYSVILLPKGFNSSANFANEFSPTQYPNTPPEFGNFSAITANDSAAVAEFTTALVSIPLTFNEYSLIAEPKGIRPSAKDANELSPTQYASTPPSLGSFCAIVDNASAAVADSTIKFESSPAMLSEYDFIAGPNLANSSPNCERAEPPVINLAIPSNNAAVVNVATTSASILTPSKEAASILDDSSMKGFR